MKQLSNLAGILVCTFFLVLGGLGLFGGQFYSFRAREFVGGMRAHLLGGITFGLALVFLVMALREFLGAKAESQDAGGSNESPSNPVNPT